MGQEDPQGSRTKPDRDPPFTVGDHLLWRRLELGLLQRQAAARLGVNKWTLVNWEKGVTRPAIRFVPRIDEFLG